MSHKTGIWIDHRKAVFVFLDDTGVRTRTLESDVESRVRMSGGARSRTPYGPQDIASESRRDSRYAHHLQEYYDEVVAALGDSESVLILGPGEAKSELKKRIHATLAQAAPPIDVEAADKLTEAQLVAQLKRHFRYVEPE